MTGRPRTCDCGECFKCKRADYMRDWWRRQSPERKRSILDRRQETNGDRIRQRDRDRTAAGRRPKPRAPEKAKAQSVVANAIARGRLIRQPCEVCGAEKVDAHHEDYSKPLDVRWLCHPHHMELHRRYPVEAF